MQDEEIGLIYNRARELSPTLGRFMQRDQLGYVDGMNLYQYLRNDPIEGQDPSGYLKKNPRISGLCIGSQLPDEMEYTDAYTLGMNYLYRGLPGLNYLNVDDKWMKDIYEQLRQLHCGTPHQVRARRACLTRLLTEGNLSVWERGFFNQALGDSYAHIDSKGIAYCWPRGHAPWHSTDNMFKHWVEVSRYGWALYFALGGGGE